MWWWLFVIAVVVIGFALTVGEIESMGRVFPPSRPPPERDREPLE